VTPEDQARRRTEARAHREEKAFVSTEAEHIEQALRRLRDCTFLAPGEQRSTILKEVVALLDGATQVLRQRV
jgi:hypothetical protein